MTAKEKPLKDRLEDYYALKKELPLIDDDILKERNKTEYAGSYQYQGVNGEMRERALAVASGNPKDLCSLLDRKAEIHAELEYLETFVFNIPESEMRQILTVAYFNGGREKCWERVADHFGREVSGDSYRVKADRFLKNLEQRSQCSRCTDFSFSGC